MIVERIDNVVHIGNIEYRFETPDEAHDAVIEIMERQCQYMFD